MAAPGHSQERQPAGGARDPLARLAHLRTRIEKRTGRGGKPVEGGIDRPAPLPERPPGWSVGPPHFVGVGVQRCGTTRWFDLISSHPEVVRAARQKELHYFDRYHDGGFGAADAERYRSYFPRSGSGITGEWTPLYMSAPWIPPLLARSAPDVRLLVLLRDPVERYLSGLQLDARVEARRGLPLSRYAPLEAFVRGLYHQQLTRLLSHFERSRILVLQYERCSQDPLAQLRRTFEFIGVGDPSFEPDVSAHPRRQTDKPAFDEGTRAAYVAAYSDDVRRLARDFPEVDLGLWPNFSHLAGA